MFVFGCTGLFFSTAWYQIMRHSHTHGGMIGKIARLTSKEAKSDRRHSIFQNLEIPEFAGEHSNNRLRGLVCLTELSLNDNQITSVEGLSELVGLTWLNLDDNQINEKSLTLFLTMRITINKIVLVK